MEKVWKYVIRLNFHGFCHAWRDVTAFDQVWFTQIYRVIAVTCQILCPGFADNPVGQAQFASGSYQQANPVGQAQFTNNSYQ